jgi:hypothetical protein
VEGAVEEHRVRAWQHRRAVPRLRRERIGFGRLGEQHRQVGVVDANGAVLDQGAADGRRSQREVVTGDAVAEPLGEEADAAAAEKRIDEGQVGRKMRKSLA